jgi:hypothetical protein
MVKCFASFIAAATLGTVGAAACAATTHGFNERDRLQVKDIFLQQAAAATGHDIVAFAQVLASAPAGQPDPIVLVAQTHQLWGKPALIDQFKETFKGVWKFVPEAETIKILPLNADVAELYARVQITRGSSEASAKTAPFFVYEVALRTPVGWPIASIVPVSAQ